MSNSAPRMLIATTVCETIECFLLPYAEHYRRSGWRVEALSNGIHDSQRCESAFDAVWEAPWTRSPLDVARNRQAAKFVRDLVEKREYDLVHVHTPVASFVTRAALRHARNKPAVVYTAHGFHFYQGGPPHRNMAFLGLEKLAGRWTDRLVVINREDFEAARRYKIVPEPCLHYMPGIGVDLRQYNPDAIPARSTRQVRDELGIGENETVFLCVAEMIPRKRHQDLLQAFAKLHGPCRLLLAGTGPLQGALREQATELGIASQVQFLGQRRDIPLLLSAANAVLLLSSQEGLPRSILEAMAMSKPVIATKIRGNRELLEDGAGLLASVGNISEIAKCMELIHTAPEAAIALGECARERVRAYDIERVIACHDELYRELLEPAPLAALNSTHAYQQ